MLQRLKHIISSLLIIFNVGVIDSMSPAIDDSVALQLSDTVGKPNLIDKVVSYFENSNKEHKDKALDVTFIGGPHYSRERKFGIGILAAGLYSTNRLDSLTPVSNVSMYVDFSTSGFYSVGFKGVTRFGHDDGRLNFNAFFESMPDYFWGIGYRNGSDKSNKTSYKQLTSLVMVDYQVKLTDGLYAGPMIDFVWAKGSTKHEDMLYLWNMERMKTIECALGLKVSYDSRDNLTAPHHGVYAHVAQKYYGKWMGCTYPFASTELLGCCYVPTWKDCTVAMQYHANITYGDTPWNLLGKFGGAYSMRGYYEGRFRDKGEMDFTTEIRQRVYRRIGVVVWGGVGTVFPKLSRVNLHQLLPDYGFGLRWEFKKNVNVRFDMGFGKDDSGFIFNINEAF